MRSLRAEQSRAVTRADLERELERVRAEVRDPRAGLFGPSSKLWEVNRSSAVFLGAGRAALLQLAHPWVATAIAQHSQTRQDPIGRFQRTFARVFAMVYGDLDSAFDAARAVHAVHARIRGELPSGGRYLANEPEALLWVHATLWDTSVRMFEAVVRPLAAEEKELYYGETRRFAALFGIPARCLPDGWEAFSSYVEGVLAEGLEVLPEAAEMGRFVLQPLHPLLAPWMRRYRVWTAHFLPPHLARSFGLGDELGETARAESSLRLARRVHPFLPRRLRYLPPYVEARRRLSGEEGRDWLGERLSRAMVGRG